MHARVCHTIIIKYCWILLSVNGYEKFLKAESVHTTKHPMPKDIVLYVTVVSVTFNTLIETNALFSGAEILRLGMLI